MQFLEYREYDYLHFDIMDHTYLIENVIYIYKTFCGIAYTNINNKMLKCKITICYTRVHWLFHLKIFMPSL